MAGHRIVIRRPFRYEYRLDAPLEVRYQVFRMNAADVRVRLAAISALVALDDPTAAEALIDALDEKALAVRVFAAEALRTLAPGSPEIDPHAAADVLQSDLARLRAWWEAHRIETVNRWLSVRLAARGGDATTPAELAAVLLAALEDQDLVLRFRAHRALERLLHRPVEYKYNWPPAVRAEAAEAIRRHLDAWTRPEPAP